MAGRVGASGKNMKFSVIGQLMTVIFNFAVRRMFIGMLGAECTGFSGLCAHILNFLSLLEPGFDGACIYCLYRPLAVNDTSSVNDIMTYIKKVYRIIGVLTFTLGLAVFPIVLSFGGKSFDGGFAFTVYLIGLAELSLSYFFTHRSILPPADQKSFATASFGYAGFIAARTVQLAVLWKSGSFVLYLASGAVCTLLTELLIYIRVGKMYPYIKNGSANVPRETKAAVRKGAYSLVFRKAGAVLCGSADNIAVFTFLGLYGGTLYSNYTMLVGICLTFVSVITGSVQAGIGNMGVTDGKGRMLGIYSTTVFAVFVLSSFFTLSLFFTFPLIITVWLGEEMVLDGVTSALFCLYLLVCAVRRPTSVFSDALGLFEKERVKAVTEALITVTAIFLLAPIYGIKGVVAGQICASLFYSLPKELYILFRFGFCTEVGGCIRELMKYVLAFVLAFTASYVLCGFTQDISGFAPSIIARIAICAFSVCTVFFVMFFDIGKFSEALRYGKRLICG